MFTLKDMHMASIALAGRLTLRDLVNKAGSYSILDYCPDF